MRSWMKRRAREKLCRHVMSRYELIKPIPKQGLFNYRCFDNAVEYNRLYSCGVVEVMYFDGKYPVLHYLNVDSNGTYLETSLGWKADIYEYYKIRKVDQIHFEEIGKVFEVSLNSWCEQFVGWFGRKILRIKRIT